MVFPEFGPKAADTPFQAISTTYYTTTANTITTYNKLLLLRCLSFSAPSGTACKQM